MRVTTANGLVFDFGLSGREHQAKFTDEKYRALAGGSPQGKTLQMLVDEHWLEWLEIVETAPWLRNWVRSSLYVKTNSPAKVAAAQVAGGSDLPTGETIDASRTFVQHKIASAIYAEAVWGYGMAGWLRGKKVIMGTDVNTRTNNALRTIYNLQGITCPSHSRKHLWDDRIYRGCGMLIPYEFGELDRWLEPLWLKAQELTKARFEEIRNSFE